MNTLRGNQLSSTDKHTVLSAYIYRQTHENARRNPSRVRGVGGKLPLISDAQWLSITEFAVTKAGKIDKRSKWCVTHHSEIPEWKAILDAHALA